MTKKQKPRTTDKHENHKTETESELSNRYKRVLADYQNLTRRHKEEKEKMQEFANEILLTKLIEILDDLEETQKHLKNEGVSKIWVKLQKILTDSGLEIINPLNTPFDPGLHEVIETSQGEDDIVTKVYRKGYVLGGKVIRPAVVAVGKNE